MISGLEYILSFIFTLIGFLPLHLRQRIGFASGWFVSLFPTRDRRVAELQLKKIGKKNPELAPQVYGNLGRVFLESLNFGPLLSNATLLDQSAIHEYWRARKPSRGLIALSAHMGNWELLAATAASQSIPLSVIGREARKRSWQNILAGIRKKNGVNVIWRSDASGVKAILSSLKKGEVVAALIDQDTEVRSVSSHFLNFQAHTPAGIIELGLRAKADFVSAFSFRDQSGCYRFSISPILIPPHEPLLAILEQYHAHLAELVQQYPEQWAWVHKRWRTTSEGIRLSSREYIQWLELL